jgi:hypothetical protein
MTSTARFRLGLAATFAVFAGCGGFGKVNQGQVVEYRKSTGLITLIGDSNYRDPANPRFDVLPPVTIHIPQNPREMGPEPAPGGLLQVDFANRRATVFDAATESLRSVPFVLISRENGVYPSDSRVSHTQFPVVDRTGRTITTYLPHHHALVVFTVPEEYYAMPDDTWKVGDEIRYYYKNPARALRLMNVTRTDLDRAGK